MMRRSRSTAATGWFLCVLFVTARAAADDVPAPAPEPPVTPVAQPSDDGAATPEPAFQETGSTESAEITIEEDEPEEIEELPNEDPSPDEGTSEGSAEPPAGGGAANETSELPVQPDADAVPSNAPAGAPAADSNVVSSESTAPLEPGQASLATHGPKKQVYGWIEDVLIDPVHTLKLPAKLDTGADTTSLDARNIRRSRRDGEDYVRFIVTEPHSGQSVELEKPFVRAVRIKGHGNEGARRVVVRMRICIGDRSRSVEVNLVDRAHYEYPLLLGRNALRDVAVIDPNLRRTREPSCWDAADSWAATPVSDSKEPAGGAPASCENAPMC
jgi:hypothetical protein